jgi:hypothetical protein
VEENVPAGHSLQLSMEVALSRVEYVPAGQLWHLLALVKPVLLPYLPAPQGVQLLDPLVREYVPMGQTVHAVEDGKL